MSTGAGGADQGAKTGVAELEKRKMDVIVIGCGAAGIAAMSKLHYSVFQNILGLEASNRIGGRICAEEFGGKSVELGAAWCQGEKKNKVFKMANPLGLLARSDPDNNWYMRSNGDLVSEDKANEILKIIDGEVASADKTGKGSIAECVRNAANTSDTLKKDPELSRSFIEWFERNNHLGGQDDPKTGKSLQGLAEFQLCEGDQFLTWKGRGYTTLLDILMNKYPDPTKEIPLQILLNKEVENIQWKTDDPTNQLVQVKCKDGSLYTAMSVIVTLPVGVLKERHDQLFSPKLPKKILNAIQNLNMCVLDKIYIEFEKPWWPKSPAKFTILWRDEDKAKFTGKDQWITEIFGLWSVDCHPNLLLAWIYGKGAEMMEKVSEEDVQAGIQKLLDTVVKKEFDVSPIKDILRTKWGANKLARGAYAYRSVAYEENGVSFFDLYDPLCHSNGFPAVCFAGEASSRYRRSTVDGAVKSGFFEAKRVMEAFEYY